MREINSDKSVPKLISDAPARPRYGRIRNSDDFAFFGVTKIKNGGPQQSLAFKIIKEDGKQIAVQYHELMSPMRFNGSDSIELATPTLSIVIKGANLEAIFDYLAEFRIVWMKEPDRNFVENGNDEPEISKIIIDDEE